MFKLRLRVVVSLFGVFVRSVFLNKVFNLVLVRSLFHCATRATVVRMTATTSSAIDHSSSETMIWDGVLISASWVILVEAPATSESHGASSTSSQHKFVLLGYLIFIDSIKCLAQFLFSLEKVYFQSCNALSESFYLLILWLNLDSQLIVLKVQIGRLNLSIDQLWFNILSLLVDCIKLLVFFPKKLKLKSKLLCFTIGWYIIGPNDINLIWTLIHRILQVLQFFLQHIILNTQLSNFSVIAWLCRSCLFDLPLQFRVLFFEIHYCIVVFLFFSH